MDMLEAEKNAKRLHEIFHCKPLVYDCTKDDIRKVLRTVPNTEGLMLFFEEGETVFGMKRITFIGESSTLRRRIRRHYCAATELSEHLNAVLPNDYENGLEYPQNTQTFIKRNMSFVFINMNSFSKQQCTDWKNNILFTLSEYYKSITTPNWLGNKSPTYEIQEFKLWAMNYRKPNSGRMLTSDEISVLESMYKATK